jgi:hypothetical protein
LIQPVYKTDLIQFIKKTENVESFFHSRKLGGKVDKPYMLDPLVETIQSLIKTPRSAGAERCSETAYRFTPREELTALYPTLNLQQQCLIRYSPLQV